MHSLTLPDPVSAEEIISITGVWFRFAEEMSLVDISKVEKNFQFNFRTISIVLWVSSLKAHKKTQTKTKPETKQDWNSRISLLNFYTGAPEVSPVPPQQCCPSWSTYRWWILELRFCNCWKFLFINLLEHSWSLTTHLLTFTNRRGRSLL